MVIPDLIFFLFFYFFIIVTHEVGHLIVFKAAAKNAKIEISSTFMRTTAKGVSDKAHLYGALNGIITGLLALIMVSYLVALTRIHVLVIFCLWILYLWGIRKDIEVVATMRKRLQNVKS